MTTEDLNIWNSNAEFWDNYMGNESNIFHNLIVKPSVNRLLNPAKDEYILDIACENGNYSEHLAQIGAKVLAFDFSPKMIELARKRRNKHENNIQFKVCNAMCN